MILRKAIFFGVAAAVAAIVVVTVPRPAAPRPSVPAAPAVETADAFMVRVVRLVAANRYGEAWSLLDSRQQRVVPRARYVRCEMESPIPGRVSSIRVLGVREQPILVPGVAERQPGSAITIRLVIAGRAAADRVVVTHTYHAVTAGTEWRWFLTANRFAVYRLGLCPG